METTGVWLVGARGNVATTTVAGARAIAHGATDHTGLVTARQPVSDLSLPDIANLEFAGHEIGGGTLPEAARDLGANGVIDQDLLDVVAADLQTVEDRIRPGTTANSGPAVADLAADPQPDESLADAVEGIRRDYREFVRSADLDRLVVVNVASTERTVDTDAYDTPAAVERAIERDDPEFPPSSLYAYAALSEGHPYLNFTPSAGASLGGLRTLATDRNVPHMGRDAKTGETLVKSALAPMFAGRNLRVRAWEGHNVLGNTDGLVLETPDNEAGKTRTKGGVLDDLLPGDPHTSVRIDYAPPLGDRKTAWDYVQFEGHPF